MGNKKKVKVFTKKKRTPESEIIEKLQSKYTTVNITSLYVNDKLMQN